MLLAGAARGMPGAAIFLDSDGGRIDLSLGQGPADAGGLFRAIPARQSTRSLFDGRSLPVDQLKQLESSARMEGVSLALITDPKRRDAVTDYVLAGNSSQMDDPAFVRELKRWIRFNPEQALETRDGLFSACSGNQTSPTLIGKTLFSRFFKKDEENSKYAAQMRSSAGVAVFTGDKADKDHWVKVGRSFQRFALQATALGIRTAMVNQPVEVPKVRAEFARWLGAPDARPDLVVRFGHAPLMPMSLRRPVKDVLITWRIMS
jgi:Nitroreductase family